VPDWPLSGNLLSLTGAILSSSMSLEKPSKGIRVGIELAMKQIGKDWTTRRLTMKTHFLILLIALVVSACASKRDVASVQEEQNYDEFQHARMIDGAASRIR
jgi:hypothetical protein